MIRIKFSEADKKALHHERFHHPHPRVQKKMEVLWLKAHGLSHAEIGRLAGVNGNTLVSYLHQYEQEGIEGLKQLNFCGQPSRLRPYQAQIEAHLRTHPPATIKEACAQIAALTGIRRSPTQVSFFLKEHCGMKRLKTGVLPAKADPLKQAEFKKTLEPTLAEARRGKRALFFVDAAHFVFGAFACVLWCWSRVWIKAPSGRERFNVLGALNAVTKEVITLTNTGYINSHSVCALLQKLKTQTHPDLPISVVLDNARYQRCVLVQNRAAELQIELLFLPTYSPNLNLIERVWKFVKKRCLYGRYHDNFAAFTAAIETCLAQTQTTHFAALHSLLAPNFQIFEKA